MNTIEIAGLVATVGFSLWVVDRLTDGLESVFRSFLAWRQSKKPVTEEDGMFRRHVEEPERKPNPIVEAIKRLVSPHARWRRHDREE